MSSNTGLSDLIPKRLTNRFCVTAALVFISIIKAMVLGILKWRWRERGGEVYQRNLNDHWLKGDGDRERERERRGFRCVFLFLIYIYITYLIIFTSPVVECTRSLITPW